MRFVKCALAIEQGGGSNVYLLEENLLSSTGLLSSAPTFIKYMNNVVGYMPRYLTPSQMQIANYLQFAQHVQFLKTKQLAFVADYQGMLYEPKRGVTYLRYTLQEHTGCLPIHKLSLMRMNLVYCLWLTLLIIFLSELGDVFADGNLVTSFDTFATKQRHLPEIQD
jgi:hypothetical protein